MISVRKGALWPWYNPPQSWSGNSDIEVLGHSGLSMTLMIYHNHCQMVDVVLESSYALIMVVLHTTTSYQVQSFKS